MTVVIDDLEVVPPTPAPAATSERPAHPPASTAAEVERALVRARERALRLEAH